MFTTELMKTTGARTLFETTRKSITAINDHNEAGRLSELLLGDLFNIGKTEIIVNKPIELQEVQEQKLSKYIARLNNNEPIQHILGHSWFYERSFTVTPDVLIPRSETEELIKLIIDENPDANLSILDIGTGSGCIAISLSLEMNNAKIEAIDISEPALAVAEKNAEQLGADITFTKKDILHEDLPSSAYDLIISNPPYVMNKEKDAMRKNVLDHEPHLALFVKDNDPLLFYKIIINKATQSLRSGGKLYFEINEQFGKEVQANMRTAGFENVEVIIDIHGKDRMVRGTFSI